MDVCHLLRHLESTVCEPTASEDGSKDVPESLSARKADEDLDGLRKGVAILSKQVTVTNLFLEAMQQVVEKFIGTMPLEDQLKCVQVTGERHLKLSYARGLYGSNEILYRVPESTKEHLLRGIASHEIAPIKWILEQEAEGVSVSLSNFRKLLKLGSDGLRVQVEDSIIGVCADILKDFVNEVNLQIKNGIYKDIRSNWRQEQSAWAPAIVSCVDTLAIVDKARLQKSLPELYPSLVRQASLAFV